MHHRLLHPKRHEDVEGEAGEGEEDVEDVREGHVAPRDRKKQPVLAKVFHHQPEHVDNEEQDCKMQEAAIVLVGGLFGEGRRGALCVHGPRVY